MSIFILQIIAMVTMFCDHLGYDFLNNCLVFRCIGRVAFPIYAFLIAEGFRHIKDDKEKVWSHVGGYILLALLSEIGYDLCEAKPITVSGIMAYQNCVFTLLVGFLGLIAIEKWKTKPLFKWSAIFATALISYYIYSDFKFAGVLLIYAFYYYLNRFTDDNYLKKVGVLFFIFLCFLPIYHWARYDFCNLSTFIEAFKGPNTYWYVTYAVVPFILASYNGKLGYRSKGYKIFYKSFYPAHLLVFGLIKQVIL